MTPPFGKCVWGCGRSNFNREHIVGQQIAKLLGARYPLEHRWGEFVRGGGETAEIVLEHRVCQGCNNGWMRKLDNRMIKAMDSAFVDDATVSLPAGSQRTIATWAVKVALLLELWLHDEAVRKPELQTLGPFFLPDDNFAAVWKHNVPPKRTRVWIGSRIRPVAQHVVSHGSTIYVPSLIHRHAQGIERGYYAVFGIGRLVACVSGWELAFPGPVSDRPDPARRVPRALLQIWPKQETALAWPPKRRLTPEHIERLTQPETNWIQ